MVVRTKYSEKLKDPRWQRRRLEIMERDGWTCQSCGATDKTLAVHHRRYHRGLEPWDYPPESLVTVCEDCHEQERELRWSAERQLIETLKDSWWWIDVQSLADALLNVSPGCAVDTMLSEMLQNVRAEAAWFSERADG